MPIIKVFAYGDETEKILGESMLIQAYDAFLVVDADAAHAASLGKKFPIEDITDEYNLRVGGRVVNTLAGKKTAKRANLGKVSKSKTPISKGPHHFIVQFIGPIKPSWLTTLRREGFVPRAHFKGFSYIVRVPWNGLEKLAGFDFVLWIGHLPQADRLASDLKTKGELLVDLPRRRLRPNAFKLEAFSSDDVPAIARAARKLGFKVLQKEIAARIIILESEKAPGSLQTQLKALSKVHGVGFVRNLVIPRTSNNVATVLTGNVHAATSSTGLKLSGEGEIVAVCDTGLDTGDSATIHPDFKGRIVAIKSYPISPDWNDLISNPGANDGAADVDSGHGTHVAGSVLGNGAASSGGAELIRGHAHRAKLVFQAVEQEMKWKPDADPELRSERFSLAGLPVDLKPLFQDAFNLGARTHSNSWGGGDPGAYDAQCRQFDAFVWRKKDFCFVIAAGNDGSDAQGNGKIALGSVTSPGTAKNCITVGACENLRHSFDSKKYGDWWPDDFPRNPIKNDPMADDPGQVVAFSSRGPTLDGRIKPDVIAPGTFILSTRSTQLASNNFAWAAYPANKLYFHMGGTSMATPITAGAVAALREFLRKKQGIPSPTAALVKALLIAGAQRLHGTAPVASLADNHQGFGRVNLDRSVRSTLATVEGKGLSTGQKASFTVKVPASGKTLRMVLAYTDAPGPRLVNNLNLLVTSPTGTRYVGNEAASGQLMKLDSINNVEVIQRVKAKKGVWKVEVVASNISQGPQDFAFAAVLV